MPRVYIADVNDSFKTFVKNAPKEAKAALREAVEKTAFALQQRMKAKAPVGPDAPHIRDAISFKLRGLTARVGVLEGGEADDDPAHVALYNEYVPNKQPFMRPATKAEAADFLKRATQALARVERDLSGGGGLT